MRVVNGNAVTAVINKEVDLLLHVANCQGRMGSGIALTIKEEIPSAYKAYKTFETDKELTLGTVSSDGTVINLHAQEFYGYDGKRYLDYEALARSLEHVKSVLDKRGKKYKIGLPFKMGCDRAGGSWEVVSSMISHYLQPDHEILVYKLK